MIIDEQEIKKNRKRFHWNSIAGLIVLAVCTILSFFLGNYILIAGLITVVFFMVVASNHLTSAKIGEKINLLHDSLTIKKQPKEEEPQEKKTPNFIDNFELIPRKYIKADIIISVLHLVWVVVNFAWMAYNIGQGYFLGMIGNVTAIIIGILAAIILVGHAQNSNQHNKLARLIVGLDFFNFKTMHKILANKDKPKPKKKGWPKGKKRGKRK